MKRWWLFAFLSGALTTAVGGIAMSQVTLIENGKSNYRIVVPLNAIHSESYAAEELQRYLERIGNIKLPIVTDNEPMTEHEILLGDNAHLRKLFDLLIPREVCEQRPEFWPMIGGKRVR